MLNNWRMAQIHAQEAPDRVHELEQWGALFDRTEKGQVLQRAFGGHTYKRLCQVGDRTGLAMIRCKTAACEAVCGEGGILGSKVGERFMERYDRQRMELSTRDVVARAIYTEVREGRGTEHGGAYLDISHKPAEYVKRKLPSMYHQFLELADVDITKRPMEVGPACHYMMGGIRVDAETAQSSLPGLFAAGEAAAGLHGANRLGGNSLSDLLVFGRRAGLAAAHHASTTPASVVDSAEIDQAEHNARAPFQQKEGESPYAIHRDLQDSMQKLVGIFRNREDLERALGEIEKAKRRLARVSVEGSRLYNPGWHLALDLKSMVTVSEAVALSALAREESRGAHSRIDFQKLAPAWEAKNNIIERDGEATRLRQENVPEMPGELRSLLADEKGETARRA